jgi:flagellar hook assembly protein FlgD
MITPGTAAALPGASTEPATGARKDMTQFGADQFITLMLAQMKNQDPMKPMEPAEFLGQLAQFSTVTGIQDMGKSVSDLVGSMRTSQALSGANLVGREVLAPGDRAAFDGSTPLRAAVDTPVGAGSVELLVRDASGAVPGTVAPTMAPRCRPGPIASRRWHARAVASSNHSCCFAAASTASPSIPPVAASFSIHPTDPCRSAPCAA